MADFERERPPYRLTDDPARIDLDAVHRYLSRSYWSAEIPKQTLARAIAGSLCLSLFEGTEQIGFSRVITDRATFAYLCDVYIREDKQGRGLGSWMMEQLMSHPDLQGLRRLVLVTRDAHELYRRVGFAELSDAGRYMEIVRPEIYRQR